MDPFYGGWADFHFNTQCGPMMLYGGWFFPYGPGVAVAAPEYLGNGFWRVRWSSLLPPPVTFYVWVNGLLYQTTQETSLILSVPPGDAFEVFVFDDPDDAPPTHYPGRLSIYWESATNAIKYRVERFLSSQWFVVHERVSTGAPSYEWTSEVIPDDQTAQYRVVAVAYSENETVLEVMSTLMVKRPDRPDSVGWSYDDGTRQLTITIS